MPSFTNATGVTDMDRTFSNCKALTNITNLPVNVTALASTFYNCISLKTAPAIPESVTDLSHTFSGCTRLINAPDIPANVSGAYYAFSQCESLNCTMKIYSSKFVPEGMFYYAATDSSAHLTINYTTASKSIVDSIIAQYGPSGTLTKGNIYLGS